MSAEAAYLIEKPHLQPLPAMLPPVYEVLARVVDLHGYVSVDTNRYSVVPERFVGQSVTVYKHPAHIRILRRDTEIATGPSHNATPATPWWSTIPPRRGQTAPSHSRSNCFAVIMPSSHAVPRHSSSTPVAAACGCSAV
jgi:hypothetical protein